MYVGFSRPTIRLLVKYWSKIALYWRDLGEQLLQENYAYMLDVIQANNSNKVEVCCHKMFQCWLEVDTEASWNKLIDALEHIHQNATAAKIREDILRSKFY